jgi:hypothetical protein
MEEFVKTPIVIPPNMKQIDHSGRGIVDYPNKLAILVVYTDSVACASCRMKNMYEYNDIVAWGKDSLSSYSPLFVFTPRQEQIEDMDISLKYSGLRHSAFIDESGLFPAANPHIPADKMFHTFLIDKNGKVVLVGDPVNNPQLWELYKTTITTLIENNGVMPEVEK